MIPIKIISKEKATKMGLRNGSSSPLFILGAEGRSGNNVADKIFAINSVTGEKHILVENRVQIMKISDLLKK